MRREQARVCTWPSSAIGLQLQSLKMRFRSTARCHFVMTSFCSSLVNVSENLQIASCKVSRLPGPERQSRGFAFVEFENGDDASAAIKGLDKSMLGDRCDPHLTTFISSNVTTFFSDMAITTGRLLCRERVVTKDIARPRVILGVYFNSQARIPSTFLFCR